MKYLKVNFLFIFLHCWVLNSQKLTLTDLTNLCSKKNWEDVNQVLLVKGWTFYDSKKGNTFKYNTITWSYKKDFYSDKAQAWFYLYTYEGLPNKVSYSVFNKESYTLIQNSIGSAGFKLIKSEIEDNEVISTYSNSTYNLIITTEKRRDSDWRDRSVTAYEITIVRKAGIYDPDNGKKTDYYFGEKVKAEYTLLNGKLNGQVRMYHINGKLKKVSTYSIGVENGTFKEFSEEGNLIAEYSMANGELHGSFKSYYPNGQLKKTGTYLKGQEHGSFIEYGPAGDKHADYIMLNGKKNGVLTIYANGKPDGSATYADDVKAGPTVEYYYDEETGELQLIVRGEYLNDEKTGKWQFFIIESGKERLIKYENYRNDQLHGPFQDVKYDSLIIGSYFNGVLNGEYKVYIDLASLLLGGSMRTDTASLNLIYSGSYLGGLKSGYWRNYDITGTLRSEGNYTKGLKSGEWKHYYSAWADDSGVKRQYSRQLFLVENYLNGKLNGKAIRYSYLVENKYPCSEIDENKNPLDTCKRFDYYKIYETSFYKDDKLHGPYELRDSTNEIISKGSFVDDLRDGEWLLRYNEKGNDDKSIFVYHKGHFQKGKKSGVWVQFYNEGEIFRTLTYQNDLLHGELIDWNDNSTPNEKKNFYHGKLTTLTVYDSLGQKPKRKYDIYDESQSSYKCRRTEYYEDGTYSSQEFWVKKEREIDHEFFELLFILSVSSLSDGSLTDGALGYRNGEFKFYDSDNRPLVTGTIYKDEKIGLWTFYYYNQMIKIESNYIKGKEEDEKYFTLNGEPFSGTFTFYDIEGDIREERKIKEGLRNGKTVYISVKTGKKLKMENYKNGVLK